MYVEKVSEKVPVSEAAGTYRRKVPGKVPVSKAVGTYVKKFLKKSRKE
ncbi:MAG: hypothetical protein SPL63_13060 [Roseburia faecis]|nr:hypothetical protein [Roseburia faecis]